MARTAPRARTVAVASAAATLTLAGCSVANPITTAVPYAPSDGVRVEVTDGVVVENLMILAEGEGEEGLVIGSVVNRSREDVEVTLSLGEGGGEVPVEVAAGESVSLNEAGLSVASLEVAPGAVLPSSVSTDVGGTVEVPVPVLDGTVPPYDEFLDGA
ncbi:hypothetical protein [Georgenia muralis]